MSRRFFSLIFISLSLFFCLPSLAWADEGNYGLDATAAAAALPTGKSVTTILGDIIGTALSLVSVLFFALMLYAGVKWMLARGDEGESTKALDTIMAAIIGLVVVLASYAITTFVFKSVGGGGGTTPNEDGTIQKSDCEINYGKDGLSCIKKSECSSTTLSLKKVEQLHDNLGKGNFKSGDAFITSQCKGTPVDIVCCEKK